MYDGINDNIIEAKLRNIKILKIALETYLPLLTLDFPINTHADRIIGAIYELFI